MKTGCYYLPCLLISVALGCGDHRSKRPDAGDHVSDVVDGSPDDSDSACSVPGALDPGFGSAGVTTIFGLVQDKFAWLSGVKIDSAARIVAVGFFVDGGRSCVVARLLPDGTLDQTFGAGGIVRQTIGATECWYSDVVLQADGKIVAVGSIDGQTYPRGLIVRYLANGTIDPTFGEDGFVLSPPFPDPATVLMAVALDTEQRIVVTGGAYSGPISEEVYTYLTRRHLSDGTLDPSFGVGGIAEEPFRNGFDTASDITIQSSGRILVNGTANTTATTNVDAKFGIVGYTPNGTKDADFGTNGVVFVDGQGTGIAVDLEDRAVAVGSHLQQAVLPLLRDDGTVEATHVDPAVESGYTRIAIDAVGRQVAIGTQGATQAVLARYVNGTRDPTFGADGFAMQLPLPGVRWGLDVAVQPDGRIVTIGRYGDNDHIDVYVARYCP